MGKLEVAFVSNKDVKKKIETLLSETKKASSIIAEFWRMHSDTLKKLAFEDTVDQSTVQRVLKRKATSDMAEASVSSSAATTSAATTAATTTTSPPPQKPL